MSVVVVAGIAMGFCVIIVFLALWILFVSWWMIDDFWGYLWQGPAVADETELEEGEKKET